MIDITPNIRDFLVSHPKIFPYVSDRVSSPQFETENGKNQLNPKIAFKQVGGTLQEPKYAFYFRADKLQDAREIASLVMTIFEKENIVFPGVSLEWIHIESSLLDMKVEESKEYECFFYARFEYIES